MTDRTETYAVHARVLTHDGQWHGARDLGTFYLSARVNASTEQHAVDTARGIVNPLGLIPDSDLIVSVYAVDWSTEQAEVNAVRDAEREQLTSATEQIAREHGANAASWVIDGTTTEQTARWLLTGIEDGDPAIYDAVREPNLSGEFAGDYTPAMLASDLGISADDYGTFGTLLDELTDVYLCHAGDAFWSTIERDARRVLGMDAS